MGQCSAPSERGEAVGSDAGSSTDPADERVTPQCSCGEGVGRRTPPDDEARAAEPFVPADTDILGPVELAQAAAVDEDDAERVRAAWDRRQRREAGKSPWQSVVELGAGERRADMLGRRVGVGQAAPQDLRHQVLGVARRELHETNLPERGTMGFSQCCR